MASDGTGGKHKWMKRKKKETGNHNITPIVALRHCRNTLVTIDVSPGVSVIDVIVIGTWDGRTNTTEPDEGGMNACNSGVGVTSSTESPSRRGR